ncbi:MAG: hypothetical protein LBJ67_14505 [Planctomycetaceae bacterium]|jgi:hypothetical protein|nr:hypothetical protein [Planctomycetaceae bacterium]
MFSLTNPIEQEAVFAVLQSTDGNGETIKNKGDSDVSDQKEINSRQSDFEK